ncbi:ATP-dependent nuclease [Pantoea phytobeneficialis]|uniref:ATP-dependent endonuclease n=1 Tax=Pantoea phytobeneficialis TaxID=2052056 RepID=A0AAP9H9C5_9GAMM|nr:ATP-dependent endonuclease [Pantoea phytobeneficialis]MDO6406396.1 ATP-dependent endonuclease [Pantoea phytobeneficialis]QGR08686.1 ATP-dependent endonuclease [Pantoea phytobeneficialis]
MILEHIDIYGFRGINRLSLSLTATNLLIGENAWGKSSLLDALTLLLAPATESYLFTENDFHFPPGDLEARTHQLQLVFRFRGENHDEEPVLEPFWQRDGDGRYLCFSARGKRQEHQVKTTHRFIDARGDVLLLDGTAQALVHLRTFYPVLRVRDARFSRRARQVETDPVQRASTLSELALEVDKLTRDLVSRPQMLSDELLRQGLHTMQQLLEHYFLVQHPGGNMARVSPEARNGGEGWRSLDKLNHLIAGTESRSRQVILLRMFSLLIQAHGNAALPVGARPMLLVEDPETRLHPIMLAVAWNLLDLMPVQKIATTNSGELLSQVPLESVCRLVREPTRVAAWRIGPEGLSAEESRRIGFHIRVNRPSALFARCWLLVEGETEVWIINELARQSGYHFAAEGVKVIEFAQSGLKPLLKFARRMGIAWHVLTDGDDAGKKYAATTRSQLQAHEHDADHLTMLPALDIENFFYKHGFSDIYHQTAHLPLNVPMNARRIITKAIHHSSKPELAIAVAMAAAERGPASIPSLLDNLFSRVIWLAHGKAD